MKIKHILIALLLFPLSLMAQEKELTLQDLIPGGKTHSKFVPKSLPQLQWNGDSYMYVQGDSLFIAEMPKLKRAVALTKADLNEALKSAGLKTVGRLPRFEIPFPGEPVLAFYTAGHRIHFNYETKQVAADYVMNATWENEDFCAVNQCIAFTEGNNVRILTPGKEVKEVTNETADGIVCGKSVHQNEFGIYKGTFWSPKGSALAFYRMDESMITDYPFVNIDARIAKAEPHKYPMAGMKSHHVTVGVYNLEKGTTVWLNTGLPKEKYLTNISWSPNEQHIYIAELNRDQNEMNLVCYSALTGKKEALLFTEKDDKYVEPLHPLLFLPNQPDQFIWQSERDGFNHLYLYNTKGELLKQLTKGEWVVLSVNGFDAKGENLFYTSTQAHPVSSVSSSPLCMTNWKLNMKKGASVCLNSKAVVGNGVHNALVSKSGKYMLDSYSSWSIPRAIDLVETKKGEVLENLLTAKNPYEGYDMPEVERGTIKAADGVTDLNYFLVKPLNMDESKKYPTVVYVYGGPHTQLVTGGWMGGVSGWDIYMARRGYVVFTVDSRGSANRGHAFESVIHRNIGVNEMADQVKGVEFLKSKPYVDSDRIGVHGWSYGGFMTTNLMCTYPDLFKVGVAGGPVIDWSNYEIMYGERYMDRPQDNEEGYKASNLKLKAKNLKGHLLIIHGDIDPVVVWQHSLGFLKACVDANTYPDYFVYPRHEHNVIGKDRPHLHEKITRYFDDYLKR